MEELAHVLRGRHHPGPRIPLEDEPGRHDVS